MSGWHSIDRDAQKLGTSKYGVRRRCTTIALASTVIAACFATLPSARADLIIPYALDGVQFADGSTATGEFDYDVTTSSVTQWNIAYSGGPNAAARVFSSSIAGAIVGYAPSSPFCGGCNVLNFLPGTYPEYLEFEPGALLSVDQPMWLGSNSSVYDPVIPGETYLTSGSLGIGLDTIVPEPPALPILRGTLGCLLFARYVVPCHSAAA